MKKTCSISGCAKVGNREGHCLDHQRRLQHLGLLGPKVPCSREGCKFFVVYGRKGLCTNCYASYRRAKPEVRARENVNKKRYFARNYEARRAWHRAYERKDYWERGGKQRKQAYYTSTEGRKKYAARTAKRRAAKLKATPAWADHEAIKRMYHHCPPGHHVDHIIPLQGKNVCGLHVEYNLQWLPASANLSKGNKVAA